MKKHKLILHIGVHKTGSTSIKHSLSLNKDSLKEAGVFYEPEYARAFSVSICNLNEVWESQKSPEMAFELYMNRYFESTLKKMLISCEIFTFNFSCDYNKNCDKMLKYIKNLFSTFDIKIVCYLRRQDFFAESLYNQLIKHNFHFSSPYDPIGVFDEPLSCFEYVTNTNCVSNLRYDMIISKWAEVFGKENIIIRPFEKCQLPNGLIHDFYSSAFGFTDNEISKLRPAKTMNESICRDILEFKIASKIDNYFIFAYADQLISNRNINQRFLTNEERKRLLAFHEEGNSFLAREFLGREDGQLFYDKIEEYEPYPGLSLEKAQEIRKIMIPLIKIYHKIYSWQYPDSPTEKPATVDEVIEATRQLYFKTVGHEYLWHKINKLFIALRDSNKTIVIYGLFGYLGDTVLDLARQYKNCVNIYIADKKIQDGYLHYKGFKVVNLNAIKAINPDVILITAKDSGEAIKKELAELKLANTEIWPAYDFSDKIWGKIYRLYHEGGVFGK